MQAPHHSALIVDDDPAHLRLAELLLEELGIATIFKATSANEALSIASQQRPELLLCDLKMPGMDGVAMLRELSEMSSPPSVLIVSGIDPTLLHTIEEVGRLNGLSMLGAVGKPLTMATLVASLATPAPNARNPATAALAAPANALPDSVLLEGLQRGWYLPHFEAKIDRRTACISGVEILARLRHPRRGMIQPTAFISRLEALGKIDELTWQIADQGLAFVSQCKRAGLLLTASLNISPSLLRDDALLSHLQALTEKHALKPDQIILEITESVAIDINIRSLERLARMRLMGFGLSIDDFGTGYASLAQLSRVPFTEMKLDRSFSVAALTDPKTRAVVVSSIELAQRMGMKTCAEGVEDKDIFQLLYDLGVDTYQGYYFHQPMAAEIFEPWAQHWNSTASMQNLYLGHTAV